MSHPHPPGETSERATRLTRVAFLGLGSMGAPPPGSRDPGCSCAMSEPVIKQARTDHEVLACHQVISQLRPHLGPSEFLAAVRRQEVQGYRLLALEEDDQVRAAVGYRVTEMLRTGRVLVIDDFVTDSTARSRGYGRLLHDRLVEEARSAGCTTVELDSAVHRTDAHRFYFRRRMSVVAFHFVLTVPSSPPMGPDRK